MKDKQVLIFGTSITYGAWDLEKGGWVERLRNFVDKKRLGDPDYYCLIYNLGVSGDTSDDILQRFERETDARTDANVENIIIFSFGINDSQVYINNQQNKTPPEKFENNVLGLVDRAKEYTQQIYCTDSTPVDDSKVDPIPWAPDRSYKNEFVKKYNEITEKVCQKNNIHFIKVFDEFMKEGYKELLFDGVHPNSEGHKKIFETVKKALNENKIL